MKKLYNHISPGLSALEFRMAQHIPPGGNWQDIPEDIPSQRLVQIRASGGRTTYYGRLTWDNPAYTITTYFNRLGNSSNLHPEQQRMISIREGARLQSFPDSFVFYGSKTSQYKQIGNAVPPLLARVIANAIKPHLKNHNFIDLFAGAGGMSKGFESVGFELKGSVEIEQHYFSTFFENHQQIEDKSYLLNGDITHENIKSKIKNIPQPVGVVVGGPPCQGFSYAGWRDPKDERNQLFKEFYDIVKSIQPEFFVMENVPGILTMRKGKAIKEIIAYFEEIGYTISQPMKLFAEQFGVPQKRRRVFIIGSKNGIKILPPTPLFDVNNDDLPNPISVKEAIYGLPNLPTKGGEFELKCDYKSTSPYEQLMMNEIDFDTFYKMAIEQQNAMLVPI